MNRIAVTIVCLAVFAIADPVLGIQPPLPMNPWVVNALRWAPRSNVTVGVSAKSRYIAFNKNESLIATDAPPTIWDARTLRKIAVAEAYPRYSLGVSFRDNGDLIVGSLGAFAIYRRQGDRLELRHRVGPRRTTLYHNWMRRFDGIHFDRATERLLVPATDGLLEFDLSNEFPKALSILSMNEASFVTDDLSYSAQLIRRKASTRRTGPDTIIVRRRTGINAYEEIARKPGNHFCLAPNGRLITIDHRVYLIKGQTLSPIAKLDSVSKATFTDEALQFAYVVRGPKLKVVRLHLSGVSTVAELDVGIPPTSLTFSPSGKLLATVDPHAGLRLYTYDQSTLRETEASRDRPPTGFPLQPIRFLDADRLLCQRADKLRGEDRRDALVCIDTRTGAVVPTPTVDGKINPVGFNAGATSYIPAPPAELAVVGGMRIMMDLENYNHPVARLIDNGVTRKTWPVADLRDALISPDGSRIAIGTHAGFVHIASIAGNVAEADHPAAAVVD